ncbi:PKD domain-containing protein [Hymenobacter sp. RP-2-7]|uniref:PKD domain-containing protein n=1 Tax=Hymenobacter polaris TaxID=2682546 RepID=A0A7Y0ACW9_9BACT|nr:GEVED domain-containing protein [Hymenobacter polaris]NML65032.1 PKD domain-containing protein [Hymenobacter polaris]
MLLKLRFWVSALGGLLPALGWAQCPGAATCTPGAASAASSLTSVYQMGIYNVTLGTINNSTAGYTDGYKDYSCTVGTSLTVSTATAISIKNGTKANENVRVWIDYNNDGTFAGSELAFSSDNKMLHTGTITPPATATLGTKLRMRVASDFADLAAPTACATPQYSQDEDYAVTLVANASPPTAAFGTDVTTTCSGCVQFSDQSANGPTSWRWNFGDNTSSTAQSPQHCYTAAGTYQVTLTATNAAGSSTSAATTITYNPALPAATTCTGLAASSYCCNYGITLVRLGSISNASADGSAGYQDFTCAQRTSLAVGVGYQLAVSTGGTLRHDTRAWLDLNNDGAFTSNEKVFEALNTANPSATITVPGTAVLNQPLRLRVVADAAGTNPQPCTAPTSGQVEDYSVTAVPNVNPPVAAFTSNYVAGVCTTPANTYTFSDQSSNGPTSWQWAVSPSAGVSFVNGTSATSQNPQIVFATAGTYSVALTATNANGSNTLTQPNYLQVQVPCLTYCTSNGGYASGGTSSFWITNVAVAAPAGGTAFGNTSGNATGGYALYSSPTIALQPGGSQTLTVTINSSLLHRTAVWIDYNRDGIFSNGTGNGGELVYNGTGNLQNSATTTIAVPSNLAATRMRVVVALSSSTATACATNFGEGEVEDYLVVPSTALATQASQALPALTLSPNPTDSDVQVQVSEASANGRYAVVVENVLGAQLLAQDLRLTTGAPATLRLAALPAGLYLVRLTNEQGQTALRRIVRQ